MSIKIGNFKLRPEIEKPIYWVHLGIIAFVVLGLLQLMFGGDMLNLKSFLLSIPLLAIGDILSHTILNID